jgi:hypothetical protein
MKKYFLPLAFVLFSIYSHAGAVTLSNAQSVALNFYKATTNTTVPLTATLVYTKSGTNSVANFYVFNISPGKGFVIVAADDNVLPILGYSTESNFHTNFKHCGLNDWINTTSAHISMALQHNAVANTRIQNQWSAYRHGQNPNTLRSGGVTPLCTTTWDQENDLSSPPPYIYNLFCPWDTTDSQRALTGCVATAMAQIMKYWNYPLQGTGSFSYNDTVGTIYTNSYGVQSSDFASHTYQWALMPTMLTDSTSNAQDSSVDMLMYDCAVSVGMDFGDDNQNGSGANSLLSEELVYGDSLCAQTAFSWYFGYVADSMQGIYRSNYSDSSWLAVLENELNIGRPFIYEGQDTSNGGHAWVCDGYDANNNLHMNWGWGGFSNGYFAVTNLTTAGNYNPILQNDALIGITPSGITPPNTCQAYFIIYADTLNGDTGKYSGYNYSTGNYGSEILWSFGDGTTSTDLYPTHTYAQAGLYTLCLTVGVSGTSCYSTYCDSTFYVNRALMLMNSISILPPLGIPPRVPNNGISVYPNPVSTVLTISSASQVDEVKIFDVEGQILYEGKAIGSQVDVSAFRSGIYIIQVSSAGSISRIKFVKE